jgi:hypothetical protein
MVGHVQSARPLIKQLSLSPLCELQVIRVGSRGRELGLVGPWRRLRLLPFCFEAAADGEGLPVESLVIATEHDQAPPRSRTNMRAGSICHIEDVEAGMIREDREFARGYTPDFSANTATIPTYSGGLERPTPRHD